MALVSGAIALGGLIAWFAVLAYSAGHTLGEVLEPLYAAVDMVGGGKAAFYTAAVLIGSVALVIEVGAVMSIGAQGRFNHLGFGAPLVGFVVLYAANQVLGLVATLFLPFGVDITTGEFTTRVMWSQFLESFRTGAEPAVVGMGAVTVGPLLAGVLSWWAVRAIERHTSLR